MKTVVLALSVCLSGCRALELLQGDRSNLLTISRPAPVLSFEVRDSSDHVLWRIDAAAPRAIDRIEYGKVPDTFVQIAPPNQVPPRPFVEGEQLTTVTVLGEREFRHSGTAVAAAAFAGGVWESVPRPPP